jgi:peptidoglycan/LPS O-acetylase OafA/YrhL
MPAYWVSIVVIVILIGLQQGRSIPDIRTLLANVLLIQDVAHVDLLSGVYWTLLIEAKFYVVMVLFCSIFGYRRIVWLFFCLVAVNVVIYYSSGSGSLLTTYLISFFPGVVATKLLESGSGRRELFEYCVVGVVSALNLYLFLPLAGEHQSAYAVIFLGLLFVALRRHLCNRVLEFFGRISYSHYLFHASIGYPLIDYIGAGGGLMGRIEALFVASIVTVGVATVSYYAVEKKAVEIGHRVSRLGWPIFRGRTSQHD